MTSTSDALDDTVRAAAASPGASVRPFFWSVRRELWENRSICIAPAIVGAVVVAGVLLASLRLGHVAIHTGPIVASRPGPVSLQYLVVERAQTMIFLPLLVAAAAITLVGALTGIFYCLAALNGERRDRSILFWKSLPVSNVTTVASKLFTPMVILPISVFVAIVVTHLAVLAIMAVRLIARGEGLDMLADLPLLRLWLWLAWALLASSLWWAPVYGWALLASAWARRLTLLWAVLPPIGLAVFERLAFDTRHVETIIGDRLGGGLAAAFKAPAELQRQGFHNTTLPDPDLAGFVASPGLWMGLAVAALCFTGAVWLRRRAEPV